MIERESLPPPRATPSNDLADNTPHTLLPLLEDAGKFSHSNYCQPNFKIYVHILENNVFSRVNRVIMGKIYLEKNIQTCKQINIPI